MKDSEQHEISNKIINILNSQLGKITENTTAEDLKLWHTSVKNYVEHIFGRESIQFQDFSKISFFPSIYPADYSYHEEMRISGRKKSVYMIESFIEQITNLGIPQKQLQDIKSHIPNVMINIEQSQTQNQTISVNFIVDYINESLSVEEVQKLKSILLDIKDGKSTSSKLGEFLKGLSSGILENILASIILNPTIISQLINTLK